MPRLIPPSGGALGLSASTSRVARPADVVDDGLVEARRPPPPRGRGRPDVRPVDHEGAVVALEDRAGPSSLAVGSPGRRPTRCGDRADDRRRPPCRPRRPAELDRPRAGLRVSRDLATGGHDEGVDPHRVALGRVPWTATCLSWSLAAVDHLVPGHRRRRRVEPRRLGDRLACTRAAACWPRTGRRRACRPTCRRRWRPATTSVGDPLGDVLGDGRQEAGLANSAMNAGSRLIMSIEESSAARRRMSCSRCGVASRGSSAVSIVYAPSAASAHRLAISS